jgi:hypothetical protein
MLSPDRFQVNEAWIVFKVNDQPIHTERDGDFDLLALMDAASCFILGHTLVHSQRDEVSERDFRRLLQEGYAHGKKWPGTLFVPGRLPVKSLISEAEILGISVIPVSEDQMQLFIGEARQGFKERFG